MRQECETLHNFVIPAKAGIQCLLYERHWVPAFAGTTSDGFAGAVIGVKTPEERCPKTTAASRVFPPA
jgi:hypothetical protein